MKTKNLLLCVWLALMTVFVANAQEKKIALVIDPVADASLDLGKARFLQSFTGYEVVRFELPNSSSERGHPGEPTELELTELYEDYDLIVIHPSIDGQNSHLYGLQQLVGKKPILNLKPFVYTFNATVNNSNDRWGWGTPNNPPTDGAINTITVPVEQQSHPIFDGLTFDDELLQLYDEGVSHNNRLQYVTAFPYTGTNTRWDSDWTDFSAELATCLTGMVIHEIDLTEAELGYTAKYLMIGVNHEGNSLQFLTNDAIQLLNNSIAYLLGDEPQEIEFPELITITLDLDGGSLPSGVSEEIMVYAGSKASLPTPAKTGYTFLGWEYEDNTPYDDEDIFEEDVTLTALWEENEPSEPDECGYSEDFEDITVETGSNGGYTFKRGSATVGSTVRGGQSINAGTVTDGYFVFEAAGSGARGSWFFPEMAEPFAFDQKIELNFDVWFGPYAGGSSNDEDAQLWFFAKDNSDAVYETAWEAFGKPDENPALFLMSVFRDTNDKIGISLPVNVDRHYGASAANGIGIFNPGVGDQGRFFYRDTPEDNKYLYTIDEGNVTDRWWTVKVVIDKRAKTATFNLKSGDVEPEPIVIALPATYKASSFRGMHLNGVRTGGNNCNVHIRLDNICVKEPAVEPTEWDYFEDFDDAGNVQGTVVAGNGASVGDGTLNFVCNTNGGRNGGFTLTPQIDFTDKMLVEFDLLTTDPQNINRGTIQFRDASGNSMFTLFVVGGVQGEIGVLAGHLNSGNEADDPRTFGEGYRDKFTLDENLERLASTVSIPSNLDNWYHVRVEVYTDPKIIAVRLTNEEGYDQELILPLPNELSLTDLASIRFVLGRTGGDNNLSWYNSIDNLAVAVDDNANITPPYVKYSGTLTFDAQGGTVTPSSITVVQFETIGELPEPEKLGFIFEGWFTEPDGEGELITAESTYLWATDMTIYAKWLDENDIYTITFITDHDAEGAAEFDDAEYILDRTVGGLPNLKESGWIFRGWFTEPDGAGEQVTSTNIFIVEYATLYAYWTENKFDYFEDFDGYEMVDVSGDDPRRESRYKATFASIAGSVSPSVIAETEREGNYALRFAGSGSGQRAGMYNFTKELGGKDTIQFDFVNKLVVEFEIATTYSHPSTGGQGQIWFTSADSTALFVVFIDNSADNRALGVGTGIDFKNHDNSEFWPAIPDQYKTRLTSLPAGASETEPGWRYTSGNAGAWTSPIHRYIFRGEIHKDLGILYFNVTGPNDYSEDLYLPLPADFKVNNLAKIFFNANRSPDPNWQVRIDNLGVRNGDYDEPMEGVYLLSFNTNRGDASTTPSAAPAPKAIVVAADPSVGELPLPTLGGYSFVEWNSKADGSGVSLLDNDPFPFEEHTTVYAIWEANKYELSFDALEGTPDPTPIEVTFDAPIGALPVVTRDGFYFLGWNITETGLTESNNETAMYDANTLYRIQKDTTLWAQWSANTASLVLSFDPKADGITPPENKVVRHNMPVGEYGYDLPVITREGYSFAGWFNGNEKITITSQFTEGDALTLEAKWVEKPERIDVSELDYYEDFEGIAAEYNGTIATLYRGTEYRGTIDRGGVSSAQSINNASPANNGWIQMNANGQGHRDSWFAMPEFVEFENALVVEFDYYRDDYYKGGPEAQFWFLGKDSVEVFTLMTRTGRSGGLAAGIAPNPTFISGNGSKSNIDPTAELYPQLPDANKGLLTDLASGKWYTINITINKEYSIVSFTVWNDEYFDERYFTLPEDYSATNIKYLYIVAIRTGGVELNDRIDNIGVKADPILEVNKVLVSFDTQFAHVTNPAIRALDEGEPLGDLPTINRTGYVVTEWNTKPDGSGVTYTASTVPEADVTLYAQYALGANTYTMSFDTQAADVENPESIYVVNGLAVNAVYESKLPEVERTGYTFEGWYYEQNASGAEITDATVFAQTDDVTAYAKWTANKYTITFNQNAMTEEISGFHDPMEVTFDEPVGTLPVITRIGYTLEGWFTANTGGEQYTAATVYKIANDLTLIARWKEEAAEQTSVPEIAWDDLNVYPNPVKDILTISGLEGGEIISIFDLSGRLVINTKATNEIEEISVNNLPSGNYFLRITKYNFEKYVKIVVE